MQTNNSPRQTMNKQLTQHMRSFMVGLVASSAGIFVALPGSAMPEPSEAAGTSAEAVEMAPAEALPVEALVEPTAEEALPVAEMEATDEETTAEAEEVTEEAPVAEADASDEMMVEETAADTDAMVEEAVAESEAIEAEPIAETEAMEDESVAETEAMEDGSVAETEVMEEESVVEADEAMEAPVAEDATGEATETETAEDISTEDFTIAELTGNSDSFETLAAALDAAELSEVLGGEGPFTVFAPTDEAFAELPEGALEQLLLPENKDVLIQVLTYHVVPGAVLSSDLESGNVVTVEGSDIAVEVADTVTVNNANVVFADVAASNGVIHVIDRVILPPAPEADASIDSTEAIQ